MPKFSVIVPVYNVAPYLREALDSVLNQTYDDWECLCVDDGSTDGSGEILDEYAERDKRFKVFHTENQGVSAARNLALNHAKGEWLCFLDGDDCLHSSLFSVLEPLTVVDKEIDLVRFGRHHGRTCEFPVASIPLHDQVAVYDLREAIPRFAAEDYLWTKIYRRQQAGAIRFEKSFIGEDMLFSCEWVRRGRKLLNTDFCGYFYRARPGSAIRSTLTPAKLSATFMSSLAIAKIWLSETRSVPYPVRRASLVMVSERISYLLGTVPSSSDKDAFVCKWIAGLRSLMTYRLPLWFSFVFSVVSKNPYLHVILLRFPYRLKLLRNRIRNVKKG